ncbi:MAG TPA: hypothetical protein VJ783_05440, partial [Pirellulales bacterium]|nr:hypothetical protein [Pirellulales bacterium]
VAFRELRFDVSTPLAERHRGRSLQTSNEALSDRRLRPFVTNVPLALPAAWARRFRSLLSLSAEARLHSA